MTPASSQKLWQQILEKLEGSVQRSMLITWFKDTAILGREEGRMIVGLPLPIALNWHIEHYRELTLSAARELDPSIEQIVYQVDISLQGDAMRSVDVMQLFPQKKQIRKVRGEPATTVGDGLRGRLMNPRYTLDSFVVGSSNRLAHAAGLAVTQQPGGIYNPLFIYGGVGLGKTHLLQGIGNEILRRNPYAAVLYTTSEEFTNDVITGIKSQKMEQIRKRYRKVDMLIIDDIQFIANKERTQEEFFHTFNTLFETQKQIVVSSDRPPRDLHILEDRLRSRFERGMIADVKMPDYETRVAILAERAQEYGIFLDQKVLAFVAEHVKDSVRTLEGILMQAVAQFELEQRMPTVQSMAEILEKLAHDPHQKEEDVGFVSPPRRALTFEEVLQGVSRYYSISLQEMMGSSRVREVAIPRQVAMFLGRKYMRMSLVNLGKLFSGRDHTTVLHAVRKIEKQIHSDPQLLRELRAIEQEVGVGS
jgi:chromosomal replication initiator protein